MHQDKPQPKVSSPREKSRDLFSNFVTYGTYTSSAMERTEFLGVFYSDQSTHSESHLFPFFGRFSRGGVLLNTSSQDWTFFGRFHSSKGRITMLCVNISLVQLHLQSNTALINQPVLQGSVLMGATKRFAARSCRLFVHCTEKIAATDT